MPLSRESVLAARKLLDELWRIAEEMEDIEAELRAIHRALPEHIRRQRTPLVEGEEHWEALREAQAAIDLYRA